MREWYEDYKILDAKDSRSLQFSESGVLVYSTFSNNQFGLAKLSLHDDSHKSFVPLGHTKQIREISVSNDSKLLLTSSQDNTIKLSNLESENILHNWKSDGSVWGCKWSKTNENLFYTSVDDKVLLFDIRKTASSVSGRQIGEKHKPVHSVVPVETKGSNGSTISGILCATREGVFWTKLADNLEENKTAALPSLAGSCFHLTSNKNTSFFMASYVNTPTYSNTCHTVFELLDDEGHVREERTVFTAKKMPLVVPKTCLFTTKDTLFAVVPDKGPDVNDTVDLYDLKKGTKLQSLHSQPNLGDVIHFNFQGKDFLSTASKDTVYLYRHKE